jgi:hypothetical protein
MAYDSPRQTRRREKLRELLAEFGGQSQVALEIGTPKSHLSAILAGRRGVGDELAQKLEQTYAKPPGWMDSDGPAATVPPELVELAAVIEQLSPDRREWALLTLREMTKLAREMVASENPVTGNDAPSQELERSGSSLRRRAA